MSAVTGQTPWKRLTGSASTQAGPISGVVATTNLAETLDPAMQRRFTLRAAFRPMDEAQVARLFAAHFGAAPPQGTALSGQTPGDFAVIARRAQLLGETRAVTLAHWLREEALLRGETAERMGF